MTQESRNFSLGNYQATDRIKKPQINQKSGCWYHKVDDMLLKYSKLRPRVNPSLAVFNCWSGQRHQMWNSLSHMHLTRMIRIRILPETQALSGVACEFSVQDYIRCISTVATVSNNSIFRIHWKSAFPFDQCILGYLHKYFVYQHSK